MIELSIYDNISSQPWQNSLRDIYWEEWFKGDTSGFGNVKRLYSLEDVITKEIYNESIKLNKKKCIPIDILSN